MRRVAYYKTKSENNFVTSEEPHCWMPFRDFFFFFYFHFYLMSRGTKAERVPVHTAKKNTYINNFVSVIMSILISGYYSVHKRLFLSYMNGL